MVELSKIGEKLLDEIIETNANINHWDEYFDNVFSTLIEERYINEQTLKSAFGELKEKELIDVFWADGKPWKLELLNT